MAVNGVKDGVDIMIGVWRDSVSEAVTTEARVVTGLVGMVILGLGFASFLADCVFDDDPGFSEPLGSILMPRKDSGGRESESELESSILQMGRWASRTSSSFSFFFSSSAISF